MNATRPSNHDTPKTADVFGVMGQLAAAAVLMRMLDSRNNRVHMRYATGELQRTLEPDLARRAQLESHEESTAPPAPQPRGPRLFVPAHAAPTAEDEANRYQMGFIPGVPVGMDHGMVRLASDENPGAVMAKVAALTGIGSQIARGARRAVGRGTAAGNLSGTLPQIPLAAEGKGLIPPAPQNNYTAKGGLFGAAGGATPQPKPFVPAQQPSLSSGGLIPQAPQQKYTSQGFFSSLFNPANARPARPASAGTTPTTVMKDPFPRSQAPAPQPAAPGGRLLGVAGGVGIGALGFGGYKLLEKGTEVASEEATPTDFSMRRFGAPRLAQTTNQYGYPQYT